MKILKNKKKPVLNSTKKTEIKKKFTFVRPTIFSRHPSHNILRPVNKNLPLYKHKVIIRFGSSTESRPGVIEINTVDAIKISANKLLMKQAFKRANVKTALWFIPSSLGGGYLFTPQVENSQDVEADQLPFPIVAKAKYGSRGQGNTLIHNLEEFNNWKEGKNLSQFIFEKFMNYGLEYRLHITEDGCFYTCRKALKKDCPEDQKWRHHDDTCVWFVETNPEFKKPNSWNDIINDCVKALKEIGADVLSFDVKVQSNMTKKGEIRPYQEYILLECNSASSMGDYNNEPSVCAKAYISELPKVINKKIKNL